MQLEKILIRPTSFKEKFFRISKKRIMETIDSKLLTIEKTGFCITDSFISMHGIDRIYLNDSNRQTLVVHFVPGDEGIEVIFGVFAYEDITQIDIEIKPKEFETQLKQSFNYSMGGLLVGGLSGLLVGTFLDSIISLIRGAKQIFFELNIKFNLADTINIVYTAVDNGFGVDRDNIEEFQRFVREIGHEMDKGLEFMNKYFHNKIIS